METNDTSGEFILTCCLTGSGNQAQVETPHPTEPSLVLNIKHNFNYIIERLREKEKEGSEVKINGKVNNKIVITTVHTQTSSRQKVH